jgi:hypothetical protein
MAFPATFWRFFMKTFLAALVFTLLTLPAWAQTTPEVRFIVYGSVADLVVTYNPFVNTSEGQGSGPSRVYRFPFEGDAPVAFCRQKGTADTPEQDSAIQAITAVLLDLYPGESGEFTLQCLGQIATPFTDPVSLPVQVGP